MSRLLTRAETAKWLRINEVTLDKLRANKQIPFVQIGRKILFDEEKIVLFLAHGGTINRSEK
jgi:excisionase family DNA binding protein